MSMPPVVHGVPNLDAILRAITAAKRSPCQSKRGVSIWDERGNITNGFNHKPPGFVCDGSDTCKRGCSQDAVHAEQHALLLAGTFAEGCEMLHVKVVDGNLVPSGPPSCVQCSKLIVKAGIRGMWLFHESGWTRYDAWEFHRLSMIGQPSTAALTTHVVALRAALKSLTNEVAGSISIAEQAIRDAVGHTNYQCLLRRRMEADEALAATPEQSLDRVRAEWLREMRSSTYGELVKACETLSHRIESHEWDNMLVWDQRDWLMNQAEILHRQWCEKWRNTLDRESDEKQRVRAEAAAAALDVKVPKE